MIDCYIYLHIYSFWLVEEGFSRTFWRRLEAGDIRLGPVHSSVAPPTTLTLNKRFLKLQQDTFFGNKDHSWDLPEIKGRGKNLREGKWFQYLKITERENGKTEGKQTKKDPIIPWSAGLEVRSLRDCSQNCPRWVREAQWLGELTAFP